MQPSNTYFLWKQIQNLNNTFLQIQKRDKKQAVSTNYRIDRIIQNWWELEKEERICKFSFLPSKQGSYVEPILEHVEKHS